MVQLMLTMMIRHSSHDRRERNRRPSFV